RKEAEQAPRRSPGVADDWNQITVALYRRRMWADCRLAAPIQLSAPSTLAAAGCPVARAPRWALSSALLGIITTSGSAIAHNENAYERHGSPHPDHRRRAVDPAPPAGGFDEPGLPPGRGCRRTRGAGPGRHAPARPDHPRPRAARHRWVTRD